MVNTLKEIDIQKGICDYLAYRHHFFWRCNNTPISEIQFGKRIFRKMPKYSMKGVPDIIVIYKGGFYGLEVKQPKGTQSLEQRKFQADCTLVGGNYFVVRSIDDVIAIGL